MKNFLLTLSIASIISFNTGCKDGEKQILLSYKYQLNDIIEYRQITRETSRKTVGQTISDQQHYLYKGTLSQNVIETLPDNKVKIFEKTWQKLDGQTQSRTEIKYILSSSGKIENIYIVDGSKAKNEIYIKNHYQSGTPLFPKIDVFPGYLWTQTNSVTVPGHKLKASTTYELIAFVREAGYDCALIKYDGEMSVPVNIKENDSTLITGENRIISNGIIYFAYKEGIIISQKDEWKISGQRTKTIKNKSQNYTVEIDINSDFLLTKFERNFNLPD